MDLYFNYNDLKIHQIILNMLSLASIGVYSISIVDKLNFFFDYVKDKDINKAKKIITDFQKSYMFCATFVSPSDSYRPYENVKQSLKTDDLLFAQSKVFDWRINNSNNELSALFNDILDGIDHNNMENIRSDLELLIDKINSNKDKGINLQEINYSALKFIYTTKKYNKIENNFILNKIEEIYNITVNSDLYEQNKYIISIESFPLLNPVISDSFDNEVKERINIRNEIVKELTEKYGEGVILKIINENENISYSMWNTLEAFSNDKIKILKTLIYKRIVQGTRVYLDKIDMNTLANFSKDLSKDDLKFLFECLPVNNDTVKFVSNNALEKYFWLGKYFDFSSVDINDTTLNKIIDYSPTSLINYFPISKNYNEVIWLKTLESIKNKLNDEEYKNLINENRYLIQEVANYMDKNYYSKELAMIEMKLLYIISDYGDYPFGIKIFFWENPKEFSKLLISISHNEPPEDNTIEKKIYFECLCLFGRNCFIPKENIVLYKKEFNNWCENVLYEIKNENKETRLFVKSAIIKILSSCPMSSNNELWPTIEVSNILEKLSEEDYENRFDVSSQFYTAYSNRRDVRTIGDGTEELLTSDMFKKFKSKFEDTHLVTAKALEYISEGYRVEGENDRIRSILSN